MNIRHSASRARAEATPTAVYRNRPGTRRHGRTNFIGSFRQMRTLAHVTRALGVRGLSLLLLLSAFVTAPQARPPRDDGAPSAPSGAITGTVLDQTGAALHGARVTLLTAAGAELRRADTDAAGQFSFAGVAASSYVIAVSKGGFEEARQGL